MMAGWRKWVASLSVALVILAPMLLPLLPVLPMKPALAQSGQTLTIGQDKVFTSFDWHDQDSEMVLSGNDGHGVHDFSSNGGSWAEATGLSTGNTVEATVRSVPPPDEITDGGTQYTGCSIDAAAYAVMGISFDEVNLAGYSWQEARQWPIKITTSFSYDFNVESLGTNDGGASWADGGVFGETIYAYGYGSNTYESGYYDDNNNGSSSNEHEVQGTFDIEKMSYVPVTDDGGTGIVQGLTFTVGGVEAEVATNSAEHGGGLQFASASITVTSIKFEFCPRLSGVIYHDDNENGHLDYNDANGNDRWDPGEEIYDTPIPNALVGCYSGDNCINSATCDEEGRYILYVPAGDYSLHVTDYQLNQNTIEIDPIDQPESVSAPYNGDLNISVDYLPVNYASSNDYELWHYGPIFNTDNVVLVHGIQLPHYLFFGKNNIGAPDNHFGKLHDLLQKKANGQYNVWQFEYADTGEGSGQGYTFGPLEDYASRLRDAIDRVNEVNNEIGTGTQVSSIIAHSMGGLVSRKCLQDNPQLWSIKLLTLGTGNFGFEMTDPATEAPLLSLLLDKPSVRDLLPDGSFLWDLNSNYQQGSYTVATMVGANDPLVKESSASLVQSPADPSQTVHYLLDSYYFEAIPGDHGINDITAETNVAFHYILDFLRSYFGNFHSTAPNEPGTQGWRPYVIFCVSSQSITPEVALVKDGTEIARYTCHAFGDLHTSGQSVNFNNSGTQGWVWVFNAPNTLDYDSIHIYSDQVDYLPVKITPGQSMIVRTLVGQATSAATPNVARSITPVSAQYGGVATAGYSGLYTKHSISIPAGSLSQDTSISISEPTYNHGLSSAVDFGPYGTTFSTPTTVTVEYKDSDIPSGSDESAMRLLVWENGEWEVVPGSVVNPDDNTVSAGVSYLSLYAAGIVFQPPVAEAGGPYQAYEGSPITFDASASHDPDGAIALYEWDFNGDGVFDVSSTSPMATFTWGDDYAGTVTLRVTNDQGLTVTDTAQVTVDNVSPSVEAGPDQTANEGDVVTFSGSSTDPGTLDAPTIQWTFGDGGTASGTLAPTHTYADNGVYTVTLTVTDKDGGVGTDTLTVTVNSVAPVVDAGPDQIVDEGAMVTFSGSFTDSSAGTTTIQWTFGDGGTANDTLTPTHVYADNGEYTVTLIVTGDGGAGSDTLTVTVNNVAPTVQVGADQVTDEGTTVSLTTNSTWSSNGPQLLPGGSSSAIRSLVVSPDFAVDPTIFAGSGSGHIYRSTDGGFSWSSVDLGTGSWELSALAVSPAYATDHTVFAASSNGYRVFKSTDSGASWVNISRHWQSGGVPFNAHWSIAVSPDYANDQTVFISGNYGVYRSTDGGASWTNASSGLPGGSYLALAISPEYVNDHTVFVGGYQGVFRSTNSGDSWTQINVGLSPTEGSSYPEVYALVISPNCAVDRTLFAGVYTQGIFKSTDGGNSWICVNSLAYAVNINGIAVSHSYGTDSTVVASTTYHYGTWTGVLISTNGGATWAQLPTLPQSPIPVALSTDGTILAGVIGTDGVNGVYSYASGSAAFTDPGQLDTHTATIDWGDGTINPGVVTEAGGGGTVSASHAYANASTYTVTLTVTDKDGGVGFDTLTITVLPHNTHNTPIGENVLVLPTDPVTGQRSPVAVTFARVTAPGDTTATITSTGPEVPGAFSLGDPPTYYDIATTASYTPPISVCINYSSISFPGDESELRLLHQTDTGWEDVTTSVDMVNKLIYGQVNSLSDFAVVVSNTPPVASDQQIVTDEDTAAAITIAAFDVDGDALTYSVVGSPSHGTLTGTAPNLTYSPGANYNGPDSFTFTANDGQANSNIATVSITVNPVNDPPVITSAPVTKAVPDMLYTYQVQASDPDLGDVLSFSLMTAPAGMTIDPATGLIQWNPTPDQMGDHSVVVRVVDLAAAPAEQAFTLTVSQNDMSTGGDAYNTANTSYGSESATVLTQTASGTGFIWYKTASGPDRYDEYRIPVNYRDAVTITFTPPAGSTGVDLLIFGADKYILLTVSNITTQTTRQVTACSNGYVYFMIKADNTSDVGIYGVTVSVTSNPDNDMGTGGDAFNTGNTSAGSENATLLSQTASGTGFIWYKTASGPDRYDEYRVAVSAGQVVTITFTPPAGSTGIDLIFFGTNKATVKTIANVTSQTTQQITAAGNGYIYIMIKADTVSDVGIYSLSVSVS